MGQWWTFLSFSSPSRWNYTFLTHFWKVEDNKFSKKNVNELVENGEVEEGAKIMHITFNSRKRTQKMCFVIFSNTPQIIIIVVIILYDWSRNASIIIKRKMRILSEVIIIMMRNDEDKIPFFNLPNHTHTHTKWTHTLREKCYWLLS
jgi:hypothetical protein